MIGTRIEQLSHADTRRSTLWIPLRWIPRRSFGDRTLDPSSRSLRWVPPPQLWRQNATSSGSLRWIPQLRGCYLTVASQRPEHSDKLYSSPLQKRVEIASTCLDDEV